MKKINVGLIGKGSFGNKILSKINLIDYLHLSWVYGSQDRWWEFSKVDWVIIATPNEFHYEQAKYYLSKGVNVFCEKPGTLSLDQLRNLIEFSNLHSASSSSSASNLSFQSDKSNSTFIGFCSP